jgi:ABC-type phosphate transport system substrate-binding protein
MYNLTINGQRVTNLRLSGDNVTKIFTGVITSWSDPAIAADNPGLTMPNKKIVPVVRSDGSGSTAQFSMWMISQHGSLWNAYCQRTGRSACGQTSYYPTVPGMIAQAGDLGVAGYVSQSYADGAVGYVNYSYALNAGFPVAKVLNAAGYYTEPTPQNVAVSLLKAQINTDASSPDYLTQQLDGVYTDPDPRTYPLSSYSYMIVPTTIQGQFTAAKGHTLAAFDYYAMCQGQQQSASLGYSPMPINLVQASFDQIRKIPGVVVQNITIQQCNNPTFSPDGSNKLADTAPYPQACDKQGPTQCASGTGGAAKQPTTVKPSASGGTGTGGGGTGGSGGTRGGGTSGGVAGGATSAAAAGSTGTGGAASSGSGNAAQQACNPDTGACATNVGAAGGSSSQVASAAPMTLAARSGWTGDQTLMLLAALLTLGLVLAPGVTAAVLARRRSK